MTTALITGASVGIGHEFANQLARRGHDLVVVARDAARLEALAKELRDRYRVEVEVLAADLTEADELAAVVGRVESDDRPVDVLVNNAGYGTVGRFDQLEADVEDNMIRLNVNALVRLCHAATPKLVERGRGAIVNVSSMAGFSAAPYVATYSATKAFVTSFSTALYEEVKADGVHVLTVCPGYTRTEFQTRAKAPASGIPQLAWQSAEQVVTAALDDLDRRKAVSVPGFLNKTTSVLTEIAPRSLARKIAGYLGKKTG